MYTITGTIEGIALILFNAPSLDMLDPPSGSRQKTEEERDEEAMRRCYRNGKGLYLPSWNLKKCLLQGFQALDLRVPGNKAKRLWRFVQPVLFIEPAELPFGLEQPDFVHKCPGRNSDGSATIVRRPALNPGWRLPFTFRVLDDIVRSEDVELSLRAAGERVGLGGWRPEHGRFVVADWKVDGN